MPVAHAVPMASIAGGARRVAVPLAAAGRLKLTEAAPPVDLAAVERRARYAISHARAAAGGADLPDHRRAGRRARVTTHPHKTTPPED